MILAPEAEPEEIENASAVRKLALMLKELRESRATPKRRIVTSAPEVIHRVQSAY
jgi:hypothetical protein